MTALRPCKSGDIGDTRIVTLGGLDNLDDVTAQEAHISYGTTTVTLALTIHDSAARQVKLHLGAAGGWLPLGPKEAKWDIEYQLTFSDGSTKTWPDEGVDTIRVYTQIA